MSSTRNPLDEDSEYKPVEEDDNKSLLSLNVRKYTSCVLLINLLSHFVLHACHECKSCIITIINNEMHGSRY